MDTEYSFGQWLRKRRTALSLTRAELAEKLGYSAAMVRKIENDERRPSARAAELLARALQIPPEQHDVFLKVARQERAVDRLGSGHHVEPFPWPAPARPRTNLPLPSTLFIGREAELARLANLLGDRTCRLVTVVGLAGTGKTRLALQSAHGQLDQYAHGVFLVQLAPLASPDMLVGTIAQAIGFQLHGEAEPETQLLHYLRAKQMLLVLDNFEHLLDGVGLLGAIMAAPGSQLLVTSRERLNLQGEWVLELEGLPYPAAPAGGDLQRVETYAAVQLFLQGALRVNPGFALSEKNRDCVVRVCQLMEGLPLGIELAAAWIRALPCRAIAREIERNLDFLEASGREIPERHRSLRSALDHSWNLLSRQEQAVLQRLSVFRGGFQSEAAWAVADASLGALVSLLDKSLLRRAGEQRYDLHELVRQYAAAHLSSEPYEDVEAHDRHSRYYAALLERWDIQAKSPRRMETLAEMDAEVDNVWLAWSWVVAHRQIASLNRSLRPLWSHADLRGRFQEYAARLDQAVVALEMQDDTPAAEDADRAIVLGRMLAQQGFFFTRLGRYAEADERLQRSLALLGTTANRKALVEPLSCLGYLKFRLGEYPAAEKYAEECLALSRAQGMQWETAYGLILLSHICSAQGAHEQALALSRESLAICRDVLADPQGTADCLLALSAAASHLGRYAEARQWAQEDLRISQMLNDRLGIGQSLYRLGLISRELGELSDAEDLIQRSVSLLMETGDRSLTAAALIDLGVVTRAAGAPGRSKRFLLEALRTAIETQTMVIALQALLEIAATEMDAGATDLALELVEFCRQHPAADQKVKDRAEQLTAQLADQLTPPQVQAIQARVKALTLESLAQEILAAGGRLKPCRTPSN